MIASAVNLDALLAQTCDLIIVFLHRGKKGVNIPWGYFNRQEPLRDGDGVRAGTLYIPAGLPVLLYSDQKRIRFHVKSRIADQT